MNNSTSCARLLVAIGAIFCLSLSAALAADTSPTVVVSEAPAAAPTTVAPAPAVPDAAPVTLPYGVDEVLKLSRAQVSEDIITSYIQSSGTIYNLAPKDIVYLRNEGVSDRVINTMLEQRKQATQMAAQTAPPPAAPADTQAAAPTYNYTQPADAQPQPAPAQTASAPSTVYVIPYPQATAAYYSYPYPYSYSYYPYYRGYYPYSGYCGPSLSVGLGFRFSGGWGGHYYGGHYGGFHGYRGGYHHR